MSADDVGHCNNVVNSPSQVSIPLPGFSDNGTTRGKMPFLLYDDEIFSPTTIGFKREDGWTHCVKGWGSHRSREAYTISKLLFPTTKKALHGFLGMVGYYRMFIHMFAAKAHPLTRFSREDALALLEDEVSRRAFE